MRRHLQLFGKFLALIVVFSALAGCGSSDSGSVVSPPLPSPTPTGTI